VCQLGPSEQSQKRLFVSITHVDMPRSHSLFAAVAAYQTHRVKKLKKL
jgi:hypothetical protein